MRRSCQLLISHFSPAPLCVFHYGFCQDIPFFPCQWKRASPRAPGHFPHSIPGFWRRNEPPDSSKVTPRPWRCNLVPVGLTGSCSFPRMNPWEPQCGLCSSPSPGHGSVCPTTLSMLHRKSIQQLQKFQRHSQLCCRWDIKTECAALLTVLPLGFDSCRPSCAGPLRWAQKHPSSTRNSSKNHKSARPPELPLGKRQGNSSCLGEVFAGTTKGRRDLW